MTGMDVANVVRKRQPLASYQISVALTSGCGAPIHMVDHTSKPAADDFAFFFFGQSFGFLSESYQVQEQKN